MSRRIISFFQIVPRLMSGAVFAFFFFFLGQFYKYGLIKMDFNRTVTRSPIDMFISLRGECTTVPFRRKPFILFFKNSNGKTVKPVK